MRVCDERSVNQHLTNPNGSGQCKLQPVRPRRPNLSLDPVRVAVVSLFVEFRNGDERGGRRGDAPGAPHRVTERCAARETRCTTQGPQHGQTRTYYHTNIIPAGTHLYSANVPRVALGSDDTTGRRTQTHRQPDTVSDSPKASAVRAPRKRVTATRHGPSTPSTRRRVLIYSCDREKATADSGELVCRCTSSLACASTLPFALRTNIASHWPIITSSLAHRAGTRA